MSISTTETPASPSSHTRSTSAESCRPWLFCEPCDEGVARPDAPAPPGVARGVAAGRGVAAEALGVAAGGGGCAWWRVGAPLSGVLAAWRERGVASSPAAAGVVELAAAAASRGELRRSTSVASLWSESDWSVSGGAAEEADCGLGVSSRALPTRHARR